MTLRLIHTSDWQIGKMFRFGDNAMMRLLQATDGKVFMLTTMHLLIDHTRIREYRVR